MAKQLSRMTDNNLEFMTVEERKSNPDLESKSDAERTKKKSPERKSDGR